jgi:hypothetical protein
MARNRSSLSEALVNHLLPGAYKEIKFAVSHENASLP